jgi:TonB-linked SusC/RagA family outer membrane protein
MLQGFKIASLLLASVFLTGNALASAAGNPSGSQITQQRGQTATGVVKDATGAGVIGAGVIVKGTTNGTLTDENGQFVLYDIQPGTTIVISCIGYSDKEVTWNGSALNIVLEENTEALEESVVTALGIKKERKALGYAVEDISGEELMRNKTANAINSLSGKIAGVNVTQSSGAAGSGAQIILRGGTSASESRDNQPLFVVDGVIYDNTTRILGNTAFDGMGSNYTTSSNGIMDLNPEDIENMSVLKGPAAAALYGSRAANGVIIITTKKGKAGQIEVNFGTKFIGSWATCLPDYQKEFKRGYMQDTYDSDGNYVSTVYNDFSYSSWGEEITDGTKTYDNIKDFFDTGTTFDTNLSVSGGTANSNFYLSASRYDQDGIVPETGYDKNTFRFNGEQKFKIFTFTANTSYSQAHTDKTLTSGGLFGSAGTGALAAVYTWAPTDDMTHYLNEDGSRYRLFGELLDPWDEKDNPYWILNKDSFKDFTSRFTGSINVRADITKWWFVNYRIGLDTYYKKSENKIAPDGAVKEAWQNGMYSLDDMRYQYLSHNIMSTWTGSLKDFHGSLMLGMQTDDTKTEYTNKMAWNFSVPNFFSFENATDDYRDFEHGKSKKRLVGVFGSLDLDWNNTVFFTMTGRNDWTSTLPEDNRSYFYPSFSGSIVFTQFLQDKGIMDDNILSFGKVRASWAKVGKDTGAYETSTLLWPVGTYLGDKVGVSASWTRGNPYLKPEMSESSEVGVELQFFHGRLKFDGAYYTNNSFNQILSPRGPQSTGYIFCSINAGNVYNKGLEFSISGTPIEKKDLTWESSLNIAGNRGTMDNLPSGMDVMYVTDVQYGGARAASFSGGDFMAIAGTKWTRYEADLSQYDDYTGSDKEELIAKEKAADGKLLLDDNGFPTYDSSNMVQVGNRESTFTGGWNNTVRWKNFTFNMLWEFRVGGDVYNGTLQAMTNAGTSQFSADVRKKALTISGVDSDGNAVTHTWEPNQTYTFSNQEVLGYNIIESYYTGAYAYETENYLTNVNSLRLRTLSVTYDIPKKILAKTRVIKRATVTAAGGNLLLFTNYDGDPEVAASGSGIGGSSSVGFDYLGTPAVRTFTFGINLTF